MPQPRISKPVDATVRWRLRLSWGIGPAVVATFGLCLAVYLTVQCAGLEELLGISRITLQGEEWWLVPGSVLSTSFVVLSPGLGLAAVLSLLDKRRSSRRAFVALTSIALFVLMLDLDLLRSVGRHFIDVVRVALQPQGRVAGGDPGQWVRRIAEWGLLSVLGSIGVTWLSEQLTCFIDRCLTPLLRHVFRWSSALFLLALVLGPHLMHQGWRNTGLYERLYGTLLLDLRVSTAAAEAAVQSDPILRELYPRLRHEYKIAFPTLGAGKPASEAPVPLGTRPPNVILIVTESLRHDVFGPELMPRLTHWAERGLVATQHDSGTIYSESASFTLLYGRSPAVFSQTLDAHVPPQFCESLRQSGYECAYFTGHPKVWMRREEFLNEHTMDHFVHDDRGTWPEWDQKALAGMLQMVNHSENPIFAIVLLMSSHFEYEYPPKYEIDTPVSKTTWHVTSVRSLGPEDEIPHRNRYRNCVRFIDDVVAGAIDQLDPAHNLVVFTGDHGESINDDGRYTHGYSFAEIITRTPFAMVGPGVEPGRLEQPTYHMDVLPSLLHVLAGQHVSIPHIQGRDWFTEPARTSALLAHTLFNGALVQTQLRTEGVRLRLDLETREPQITLLGFEDAFGHLIATPALSSVAEDRLVGSFEEQLALLRR